MANPKVRTQTEEETIPDVRPASSSELVRPSQEDIDAARDAMTATTTNNDEVMQTFVTWLTERAETTDEDQYAVMASILAEIMAAEDSAEVMKERQTMSGKQVIGVPLLLHGFEIREGSYEDSLLGFYAAMTVSRPGSETTRILTCGATKVLMKLYKLDQIGEWPQLFWFTSKQGKKGDILDIVRD